VMMTTYCLPIHTHKMVDVHTKGGGPCVGAAASIATSRSRSRSISISISIDRSIDRARGWVGACMVWVSHGFRIFGFRMSE